VKLTISSEDLTWRKSSYSGSQANCVEIGITASGSVAGIRDSKSPERGHLAVAPEVFAALLAGVKSGRADLPRLGERQSAPVRTAAHRG
jgi:hypothetical protein